MKPILIRLEPETHQRLTAISDATGFSIAEIMRDSIHRRMDVLESIAAQARAREDNPKVSV